MRHFFAGALALALAASPLLPLEASANTPETEEIEIYVVNSHTVSVRVFAEDMGGRLHSLGRIEQGEVTALQLPDELAGAEYRLKFVPAPQDVWSPVSDQVALVTAPLSRDRVRQVTVWIEQELSLSDVEVEEVVATN